MDSDIRTKKQVNFDQLKVLVEFVSTHQELAKGLMRGQRGKLHTCKLWNLCAKKLNVVKDGAVKDGKGWAKYWCDWKYRVKRRALELKAAKDSNRIAPEEYTPLSSLEETIIGLIGDAAVDVVIKNDPLGDEDVDDEEVDNIDNTEETLDHRYASQPEPVQRRSRKRRHSYREYSDDHGEPSSPVGDLPPADAVDNDESDTDEAAQFLRLEREKIENARKLHGTLLTLTSQVTRLADVLSHIRDVFVKNRVNI